MEDAEVLIPLSVTVGVHARVLAAAQAFCGTSAFCLRLVLSFFLLDTKYKSAARPPSPCPTKNTPTRENQQAQII